MRTGMRKNCPHTCSGEMQRHNGSVRGKQVQRRFVTDVRMKFVNHWGYITCNGWCDHAFCCRMWRRLVNSKTVFFLSLCPLAFSCKAGEFLEMSAQECTQCAAGSYSLGSGIRFDQWDYMPIGFSSLATSLENSLPGYNSLTCNR